MDPTHAIVNFFVDNAVEVVPVGWLSVSRRKCPFPVALTKEVTKMIKRREAFNPNWIQYDCRVVEYYGLFVLNLIFDSWSKYISNHVIIIIIVESYAAAKQDLTSVKNASDLSSFESSGRKVVSEPPKLPQHPSANLSNCEDAGMRRGIQVSDDGQSQISQAGLSKAASHELGLLNDNDDSGEELNFEAEGVTTEKENFVTLESCSGTF